MKVQEFIAQLDLIIDPYADLPNPTPEDIDSLADDLEDLILDWTTTGEA